MDCRGAFRFLVINVLWLEKTMKYICPLEYLDVLVGPDIPTNSNITTSLTEVFPTKIVNLAFAEDADIGSIKLWNDGRFLSKVI